MSYTSDKHNPLLPALPDIVWSLVVLVVIVLFFWRYVLPKVDRLLQERSRLIEGRIAEADRVQRQALETLETYRNKLSEAKAEVAKIREDAHADAGRIIQEAKTEAELQAKRTVERVREQIEAEKASALVSLRSEVSAMALVVAGRVIDEKLDDEKSRQLVDAFVRDMDQNVSR